MPKSTFEKTAAPVSFYFTVHALDFNPETYKSDLRIINIKIAPKESTAE